MTLPYTLIVGLGNPGAEYENTYHNVGVKALKNLAERLGASKFKDHGLFSYAKIETTILAEPHTFMNESGRAVASALKDFSIPPEQMAILHDDSDITLGEFKITTGQRSAGHHGIDSIIAATGTSAFTRIRIGIRPKDEIHRKKASEIVLAPIKKSDAEILENVFEKIFNSLG